MEVNYEAVMQDLCNAYASKIDEHIEHLKEISDALKAGDDVKVNMSDGDSLSERIYHVTKYLEDQKKVFYRDHRAIKSLKKDVDNPNLQLSRNS